MSNIHDQSAQDQYWTNRYKNQQTGWDIGYPATPLKEYIDQLKDKKIRILIPGAGNAYEAEYLHKNGFTNVYVLDISNIPLTAIQNRIPDFPSDHLLHGNFFDHQNKYDLILEQTFFCSFPPLSKNRKAYAKKMSELLSPSGKLVGLWFDIPLTGDLEKRPFGGDKAMYLEFLSPYFDVKIFETAHNSISPRAGTELFGIFIRK